MNGFDSAWLTWLAFVGQFTVLGWVFGPVPVGLVRRGLLALGWNLGRPSVEACRGLASLAAAAIAVVELLRRLRIGEQVTLGVIPVALSGTALVAGRLGRSGAGVRREVREVRAQLLGAAGLAFVAAVGMRPALGLVPAGVVAGLLVGLVLVAVADWHLVDKRMRPLFTWLSISEPPAREPFLATRRLLVLAGALPGAAVGAVLALRQWEVTSAPPSTCAALAGAATAVLAAAILLARRPALGRRLSRAFRGEQRLDRALMADARALSIAAIPSALSASAAVLVVMQLLAR